LYIAGAPFSVSNALLIHTSVQSATPSSSASRSITYPKVSFDDFNVLKSKSIVVLEVKLALSPPSGPQNVSSPITQGIVVLIEVNSPPQLITKDPSILLNCQIFADVTSYVRRYSPPFSDTVSVLELL